MHETLTGLQRRVIPAFSESTIVQIRNVRETGA
jgi:hypothetical protein